MYLGSCLCGKVTYRLESSPGVFVYCFCVDCRKGSGSAHSANASIDLHDLRFLSGELLLREFESSPGQFRLFCSNCGSPIYSRSDKSPGTLRLRLGTLDTSYYGEPKAHIWVSQRANWDKHRIDIARFETGGY